MGRKKKIKAEEKEHLTQDILLGILKTGAIIGVALIAPNALQVIDAFTKKKEFKNYYPSSINRQIIKLWRKGFVKLMETESGHTLSITEEGKTEILKYNLDSMRVTTPEKWDGKWRMVFFDIPQGNESSRTMFRRRLKSLGLFQMQKSVYVFPYPCSKEIMFLREVYGIPHSVKLAIVERLENDEDLKKIFGLVK